MALKGPFSWFEDQTDVIEDLIFLKREWGFFCFDDKKKTLPAWFFNHDALIFWYIIKRAPHLGYEDDWPKFPKPRV